EPYNSLMLWLKILCGRRRASFHLASNRKSLLLLEQECMLLSWIAILKRVCEDFPSGKVVMWPIERALLMMLS
ncbi:MAG: hypothetical protein WCA08_23005, partial [Desulfoferrobacter sp.]